MPKHPSFPSVSRKQQHARAQVLERAAAALRMRQFAEAEQLAAEVLRANRADSAAVSILARSLIGQNRGGEARTFGFARGELRRTDRPGGY